MFLEYSIALYSEYSKGWVRLGKVEGGWDSSFGKVKLDLVTVG